MFIKSVTLQNFKCFKDKKTIYFEIPNEIIGSGINIFVGANNSGKSTIFEAINFLRDNTKKHIDILKNIKASKDAELFVEITFCENISDINFKI